MVSMLASRVEDLGFVLDQRTELDFYSANSFKQQSASRNVVPLGHIILIPNQPVIVMYINKLYITCTEVYFKSNYLFFGVVSKYS
jgi:hypothetical protein